MKNFKALFISLTFLLPTLSFAQQTRITDGKDHLKLVGKKIEVKLDKGFHFVMASPAGLYMDGEMGSTEPMQKTEDKIVFDVSKVKDKSFTVSYYVCDDKKTVCESHEFHLKVQGKKLVNLPPARAESVEEPAQIQN